MDAKDRRSNITLRVPPDLHAMLTQAAEQAGRPLNTEIIRRLRDTFDAVGPAGHMLEALGERLTELDERLAKVQDRIRDIESSKPKPSEATQ